LFLFAEFGSERCFLNNKFDGSEMDKAAAAAAAAATTEFDDR
jgi:hypothetical protein